MPGSRRGTAAPGNRELTPAAPRAATLLPTVDMTISDDYVVPYQPQAATLAPGKLSEALVFEKDIVSPLGAGMWEVTR